MLSGFPWVTAIIIYTLSWGGSLLRPNTLYWDDWAIYFDQPIDNGLKTLKSMGRPPWGGVIEFLLLHVGPWLVCLATFVGFFSAGLFLFGILRTIPVLSKFQRQAIVLLFLVVPVNHARIAITVFDYSSSYFLFFLGWLILVRTRSIQAFLISWVLLFLSVKTHSLLFFMLVPFTHFLWLRKNELLEETGIGKHRAQSLALALLPFVYVLMRASFWPPSSEWSGYNMPTLNGSLRGAILLVPVAFGFLVHWLRKRANKTSGSGAILFIIGSSLTALALFPYFVVGQYSDYVSVIAFRADWGNRHQLLTPLGLSIMVVGLNELWNWQNKNIVISVTIIISLACNLLFASQYFLDSLKKDQVAVLFSATPNINATSEIVIIDDSKRFNGRGSMYRDYEWAGLLGRAGYEVKNVSGKRLCDEHPDGQQFTLRSDTPYLRALVTRDLELYFDIQPCSEILAQGK